MTETLKTSEELVMSDYLQNLMGLWGVYRVEQRARSLYSQIEPYLDRESKVQDWEIQSGLSGDLVKLRRVQELFYWPDAPDIVWFCSGNPTLCYWLNGHGCHREHLPSRMDWSDEGVLKSLHFDRDGYAHSTSYPAAIRFDEGKVGFCAFYVGGNRLTFWEFYAKSCSSERLDLLKHWLPLC